MAKDLDPLKLSSPRIFLFRMMVFVVLVGLVAFLLHKQIEVAFMSNPGLNALILGVEELLQQPLAGRLRWRRRPRAASGRQWPTHIRSNCCCSTWRSTLATRCLTAVGS